ncbi:hypothetical protein [Pseudalkalibacillus berkeleyi]|uniref:DUF2178 domain-containing protein n=1 Tax=Pseudalkalibacillus berkeleyi TaxID=1069813 RepID=A0ABS9GYK5_9BACL|nr:hypothetical protein [Pseudalkalibacillus berkeleyi]MCF6137824.1 hypothetical protein [Pseudalkalibacillus berkeleyi]
MEKLVKETKLTIIVSLLVSFALFVTWIILELTGTPFTDNKAFLALSLIPFSVALASFLKLMKIQKSPNAIISETDERIVAQKNEADAKTLKVLQGILFLLYLAYTFIVPEDVFKSIVWWGALGILFFSLFAPFMFRYMIKKETY